MTTRTVAWALLGLLWFGGTAEAQVGADSLRLTLNEAVSRAVGTSEEVRAALAQQNIAESQVVQTRAGALPQVNANLSYNRTLASIFDGISLGAPDGGGDVEIPEDDAPVLPFGRPNTWMATLSLTQPLYSGGRISTGLAIASNIRRASALDVMEAQADIALQTKSAYLQAVLAEHLVDISEEAYALADAQLQQVELFEQQGTASEFEVLSARVERDNLEPGIVEARNALRLAELNLKRLVNLPADQSLELVTPLEPVMAEVDGAALRAALTDRPAVEALEQVVAAREGAVRVARAARLPSVGASANFSYQAFPSGVAPVDAEWMRDWTLGFQVSIPVFTGMRTSGAIEQASAELVQAELQRDQAREGLELELEAALGEFEAARTQIVARQGTVDEALRALELAELRFATGMGTQLEVSNARLLLEQARVNEAQSLYNYLNALARIERTAGVELPVLPADQ
ncbi:MAG: TolC family protein [Gemmatimonadota bacterium]